MEYRTLVDYYIKIESTSKRLQKTKLISELLKETPKNNLKEVVFLLQGRVFPQWDEQKIGVAAKLVLKALNLSSGIDIKKIEQSWKNTGDLGETTKQLIAKKKQSTLFSDNLLVKKVFNNLVKLATLEGSGTVNKKIGLISELLTSANSDEAKYITRTVVGDLRIGASEGTLRDAVVRTYFEKIYETREENEASKVRFKEMISKTQHAYDLTNDFSKVVMTLEEKGEKGLDELSLTINHPVNPMLFPKAKDIEDGFKTVGKPAMIEFKYDGFRVQIHKDGDKVELFTRRLEKVTHQFPDVVENIKNQVKAKKCILDSEVLGIEKATGKMLPFQNISQRIRRKYDINELVKKVPVINIIFDILMLEDNSLLETPFEQRRKNLENTIIEKKNQILLSKMIKTDDEETANEFYQDSLMQGQEGIMMKALSPGYKPGARVGYAIKVKPVLEPLDLIITGAEWGHGKRAGWLTSFSVSCKDMQNKLVEIGKVGTGIKELEAQKDNKKAITFKYFTELLKPLIISEENYNVSVKPEIIVEVDYEEIQASNNYNSGFALRFPRIKRIRDDLKEPCTIEDIKKIYEEQRGRGE